MFIATILNFKLLFLLLQLLLFSVFKPVTPNQILPHKEIVLLLMMMIYFLENKKNSFIWKRKGNQKEYICLKKWMMKQTKKMWTYIHSTRLKQCIPNTTFLFQQQIKFWKWTTKNVRKKVLKMFLNHLFIITSFTFFPVL